MNKGEKNAPAKAIKAKKAAKAIKPIKATEPIEAETLATLEQNNQEVEIRSIKDVAENEMFTKHAFWKCTNLKTSMEFELTGIIVNLYLGSDNATRTLLNAGVTDYFTSNGLCMKFQKCIGPSSLKRVKTPITPTNKPFTTKKERKHNVN